MKWDSYSMKLKIKNEGYERTYMRNVWQYIAYKYMDSFLLNKVEEREREKDHIKIGVLKKNFIAQELSSINKPCHTQYTSTGNRIANAHTLICSRNVNVCIRFHRLCMRFLFHTPKKIRSQPLFIRIL